MNKIAIITHNEGSHDSIRAVIPHDQLQEWLDEELKQERQALINMGDDPSGAEENLENYNVIVTEFPAPIHHGTIWGVSGLGGIERLYKA